MTAQGDEPQTSTGKPGTTPRQFTVAPIGHIQRATLRVHPRGNAQNPLTGVFATRSPRWPNLVALSLCRLVSVKENVTVPDWAGR